MPKYSKNIAWRLIKHYILERFGSRYNGCCLLRVRRSEVDLDPDDQLWTYAGFDVIRDLLIVFFVDPVVPDP
jgi:hypothetical protein